MVEKSNNLKEDLKEKRDDLLEIPKEYLDKPDNIINEAIKEIQEKFDSNEKLKKEDKGKPEIPEVKSVKKEKKRVKKAKERKYPPGFWKENKKLKKDLVLELLDLRSKYEELTKKYKEIIDKYNEISEYKDRYLRLVADFDNFRKRVRKEKEEIILNANRELISKLLPILDNIDLAEKSFEQVENLEEFKNGVKLIFNEFRRVLELEGLEPIKTENEKFDPNFHEAIMQVETKEYEDNDIVDEFRRGYLFKGKLLRASMVSVAKKIEENEEESERK